MIKKYQDKEWLENKYIKEKLSPYQIAEICKAGRTTVRRWMIKFNILTRSRGEAIHLSVANHCNLSQKAIEWIDGELLGDGCLFSESIYSASFKYTSKYFEYINYISDTLKSFGIKQAGKITKYYYKNLDTYDYRYSSLAYSELLPIYKQWYIDRKKIVPKDINLTPLVLRQHFIGDGSLEHPKTENGRPRIRLYTCGFSIFDVNWLVQELTKSGFKTMRQSARNTIVLSTHSTKEFLNYIGKCPVECYRYKFKYY